MKKLLTLLTSIAIAFATILIPTKPANIVSAVSEEQIAIMQLIEDFIFEDGEEIRKDRSAGSKGELEAASFIQAYMLGHADSFSPRDSTTPGFVYFSFRDATGEMKQSQNIIFTKKGTGDKKIVLTASYDNNFGSRLYSGQEDKTTGFNETITGMITLMSIATKLNSAEALPFDVELVFFGAEKAGYLGSANYTIGIDEAHAEKIIFMMDFNNLVGNDKINVFSSDFDTRFSHHVASALNIVSGENNFNLFKPMFNISDQSYYTNLPYSHIGLESSINNFNRLGIPSVNIFAGDYSGLPSYTENHDTYENYLEIYGMELAYNIEKVSTAVSGLLSTTTGGEYLTYRNSTKVSGFWTDERASIVVLLLLFVLTIILYIAIRDYLKVRFFVAMSQNKDRLVNIREIYDVFLKEVEGKNLTKAEASKRLSEIIKEKIDEGNLSSETDTKIADSSEQIDDQKDEQKIQGKAGKGKEEK